MIVKQIWTGNRLRNFNYLIVCPESGQALAIDPLDYRQCLRVAKENSWTITQILNTHEHHDHIAGNTPIVTETGATILAHHNAKKTIPNIDVGLKAGDVIKVGKHIELLALDTPGHTMSHICALSQTESPSLFSGDTLFNAGAGNCHQGGHPLELYATFTSQLAQLGETTLIYPGHDYIENNLQFTLDCEPDNTQALQLLESIKNQDPGSALVTSIALEKQINTFFRLHNPSIIANLREKFPEMNKNPSAQTVFTKLRELRNQW